MRSTARSSHSCLNYVFIQFISLQSFTSAHPPPFVGFSSNPLFVCFKCVRAVQTAVEIRAERFHFVFPCARVEVKALHEGVKVCLKLSSSHYSELIFKLKVWASSSQAICHSGCVQTAAKQWRYTARISAHFLTTKRHNFECCQNYLLNSGNKRSFRVKQILLSSLGSTTLKDPTSRDLHPKASECLPRFLSVVVAANPKRWRTENVPYLPEVQI